MPGPFRHPVFSPDQASKARLRAKPDTSHVLFRFAHANQMLDLGEHAAGLRCIRQLRNTTNSIEPEPDQSLALAVMAAYWAADLLDFDSFCRFAAHFGLASLSLISCQSAACSLSAPSRPRACSVDT